MSCWRQKAFPEIITEIRGPLADGVKGTGCRGAGGAEEQLGTRGLGEYGGDRYPAEQE